MDNGKTINKENNMGIWGRIFGLVILIVFFIFGIFQISKRNKNNNNSDDGYDEFTDNFII